MSYIKFILPKKAKKKQSETAYLDRQINKAQLVIRIHKQKFGRKWIVWIIWINIETL